MQWVYPNLFGDDFINRLGGMQFLMSFVGAIGSLMSNSGLENIMKAAFGGVAKMLTGKKYPQKYKGFTSGCRRNPSQHTLLGGFIP
jgi:hypothetical protein